MIRIYRRLWETNWASQWQYRANFMMYLLYWLVSPIVYLSVWTTVARGQGSVNGLTANDFATYYLTLLIVDTLISDVTIYFLAYKIQDGTLSNELLLPVHPILTNTLINNLAFKALTMIALLPVWTVLCLLIRPDYSSVTLLSILLAVPAVFIGFGISFLFGAIITCAAFWTTRVYSLAEIYTAILILFAGQFVPLNLMPPVVQNIARFLPFQLLRYFPIELILNRVSPKEIAFNFGMGLFWFFIALALFTRVWKAGLKRYSAVGA